MANPPKDLTERLKNRDLGVIMALLDRLNSRRLPYAQQLKKKVDQGECLSDFDMRFLKKVMDDGVEVRRLVAKHPQYQEVANQMADLYSQIMSKGLENQKAKAGKTA